MRHAQAEEWSGTPSEVHRLASQGVDLQNICTAFPAVPRLPSPLCGKTGPGRGPLQRAAAGRDGTLPGGSEPTGIQY